MQGRIWLLWGIQMPILSNSSLILNLRSTHLVVQWQTLSHVQKHCDFGHLNAEIDAPPTRSRRTIE
jgi:hypothetical protein